MDGKWGTPRPNYGARLCQFSCESSAVVNLTAKAVARKSPKPSIAVTQVMADGGCGPRLNVFDLWLHLLHAVAWLVWLNRLRKS